MVTHHPGVDLIHMYVAISLVKPWSALDRQVFTSIMNVTKGCKWLKPVFVILKENEGRDFSSAKKCLEQMAGDTMPDDYLLIRNRSSRGPGINNWYKVYVDQFCKFSNSGLVGSTIILTDHFSRGNKTEVAHIQTYAYMSQWKFFTKLMDDFPGEHATNHLEAILQGEIGLSQRFLSMGLSISALHHPDLEINSSNQHDDHGELKQKKVDDQKVPIIHKWKYSKMKHLWQKLTVYSGIIPVWFKRKENWVYFNR